MQEKQEKCGSVYSQERKQSTQAGLKMAWMLKLSDRIFSITTINILLDLLEKENWLEQMGNACSLSITVY